MSFRLLREIEDWFLALFRRDAMQDGFDIEMGQHLEFMIDEVVEEGCHQRQHAKVI